MTKIIFSILTLSIVLFAQLFSQQEFHWYKGNTHTHTTNSDGNELPRRVVRWYVDHEYNFLVITDHDRLTDIKYLDTDKNNDFILIPGEEISDRAEGKPVHINGIGIKNIVNVQHGNTRLETIQNNVDAVIAAGGIPQINHPNWRYSFNDSVLSKVKKAKLVEVYNVSEENNNYTAGGFPGTEEIWDKILSQDLLLYGVVSDDAHDYVGEFTPEKSPPGTGWIMVRAKELTRDAILSALNNGDFYGTNGVYLKELNINDKEYAIEVDPFRDAKYTIQFIGSEGKILKEEYGYRASYRFRGDEKYVRAKVICSSGDFAITQPVFIK